MKTDTITTVAGLITIVIGAIFSKPDLQLPDALREVLQIANLAAGAIWAYYTNKK